MVTSNQFLNELIRFDSTIFFEVIVNLFKGEPYCFIVDEIIRQRSRVRNTPEQILDKIRQAVNKIFKEEVDKENKILREKFHEEDFDQELEKHIVKDSTKFMKKFEQFILNVFVEHKRYQEKLV